MCINLDFEDTYLITSLNLRIDTNIEIAGLKYIKGKAFDVFSKYNEKSETLLTSAVRTNTHTSCINMNFQVLTYGPYFQVKLDPFNLDAWASLGTVMNATLRGC